MANYGDTNAWITLDNGTNVLYLRCEDWQYGKTDPSATGIDYPNRGHFGFTLSTEKLVIKIKKAYVTTEAQWNVLKAAIIEMKDADKVLLRIKISSTTYEMFDGGTNDLMPVIIKSDKGYKKPFKGDATIYEIGLITLFQSGDLEAT